MKCTRTHTCTHAHTPLLTYVHTVGDTPTLPLLINFPAKTGSFNILRRLGNSYIRLGVLLLQDHSRDRVTAIKVVYQGTVNGVCIAIMAEWLKGGGLQPVTWATLTSTMANIGLYGLAEEINETLAPGHPSDEKVLEKFLEIRSAPPLGQCNNECMSLRVVRIMIQCTPNSIAQKAVHICMM